VVLSLSNNFLGPDIPSNFDSLKKLGRFKFHFTFFENCLNNTISPALTEGVFDISATYVESFPENLVNDLESLGKWECKKEWFHWVLHLYPIFLINNTSLSLLQKF
jgi:hypothetical protein